MLPCSQSPPLKQNREQTHQPPQNPPQLSSFLRLSPASRPVSSRWALIFNLPTSLIKHAGRREALPLCISAAPAKRVRVHLRMASFRWRADGAAEAGRGAGMLRPAGCEGMTVVRLLLPHPRSLEISSDWIHLFIYLFCWYC